MSDEGIRAAELFRTIGESLAAEDPLVGPGKTFGMPCLKTGKKVFAGLQGDAMVFKLGGAQHGRALTLDGAHLFDPMGGRPMKEWVQVPIAHSDAWRSLAAEALHYVSDAG
jgi:hypothetical protein